MSIFYHDLGKYIEALEGVSITEDRKRVLDDLAEKITAGHKNDLVRLVFICTHNSRRSHFAQIWASVLAVRFGLEFIEAWSGGTEATAFHPNALAALERAGFVVDSEPGPNPVHRLSYGEAQPPLLCFSKVYDHPDNPTTGFAAIMTCSDAEENCPFIPGADWRFSLTYSDPKIADGTPEEAATYDARLREIGGELWYVMDRVRQHTASE